VLHQVITIYNNVLICAGHDHVSKIQRILQCVLLRKIRGSIKNGRNNKKASATGATTTTTTTATATTTTNATKINKQISKQFSVILLKYCS
jgi:hypothetical protein